MIYIKKYLNLYKNKYNMLIIAIFESVIYFVLKYIQIVDYTSSNYTIFAFWLSNTCQFGCQVVIIYYNRLVS